MAVTITNTEFNGDVLDSIYEVLGVGNEVIEKGIAYLETGIAEQRALPILECADDPIGAYLATPSGETADTDYSEKILTMKKMMIYETFSPADWLELWPMFRSVGSTFTNLAMNPEILRAVLNLYRNKIGKQLSKLFFQGDTTGATAVSYFDGLIKGMVADSDVVDITNIGAITSSNVVDVLEDIYEGMPIQFLEDPDWKLLMNSTNFRMLQSANNTAKKTSVGVLSQNVERLFLEKRIEHFSGIPANTIIGAKGTTDQTTTNLFFGMYASLDDELSAPRIMRVANNSDSWFLRINLKAGMQYREGSELCLYQGS